MTATLGSSAVSRARLRIPRYGAAVCDGQLLDDSPLAAGTRATLTIGDLAMVGTVRPGAGAFGGVTGFSWIAGGDGWSRQVDRRRTPPHDDGGIRLSAVGADLARDAQELGAVLEVPDRVLGRDWTRPAALARDLLQALSGGQWWVAGDGTTHLGPRPAANVSLPLLTVDPFDPALRWGVARVADDGVAQLLPGATLTAQGLPAPLTLGQVVLDLDGEALKVELWGERTGAELFAAMVDALTAWRLYLQANPYTVTTVGADGRVAVRAADARSVAFPDAPALDHVPGVPGASWTLQPGAAVVVEHLGGDPGSPVVRGYPAGVLPVSVGLSATTQITASAPSIQLGGTQPVVLDNGGGLTTFLTAVANALNALGHPIGGVPIIQSTKVTAA